MYHVAICDDEVEFIVYMKKVISELVKEEEIIFHEYLSGEALLEELPKTGECHLLILDIQLQGMDGNMTGKRFRQEFPDSVLVFCSGVYLPTVESFEVTPYRYLLKEYTKGKMKQELVQIIDKMKSNKITPYVIGKKDNNFVKLYVNDIWYIENTRRGSLLHCYPNQNQCIYTTEYKLKKLQEELKDYGSCYAHNSYLVNLEHVIVAGDKELELDNGEKLSIARSKVKEFRQQFAYRLAGKY